MKKQVPAHAKSLGEAIRLLREDQGLTLRSLAEKVGVSAPFLSDLEHGRRQTDKYEELAIALNVPVEELKGLDARVSGDLKAWLSDNPKLVSLLRDMQKTGYQIPHEALRKTWLRGR